MAASVSLATAYVEWSPVVLQHARRMARDPSLADDLAQEAWAVAVEKWDAREPGSVIAWLYAILRFIAQDAARPGLRFMRIGGYDRRLIREADVVEEDAPDMAALATFDPRDGEDASEEMVARAAWLRDIALPLLPEMQREVIRLHCCLGMTREHVAEELGITNASVGAYVREARRRLTEMAGSTYPFRGVATVRRPNGERAGNRPLLQPR